MSRYAIEEVFATPTSHQHFFGYYDLCPFDAVGNRLLSLRTDVFGREVEVGDLAIVGYWELSSGEFVELAETRAFNFQQGAQLQWLGPDYANAVVFNDLRDGHPISVIVNVESGERRELPHAIASVSSDGETAVSIDYARHAHTRPSYSYAGITDPSPQGDAPADDALYRVDLRDGERSILVTLGDLLAIEPTSSMLGRPHAIEHPLLSPSGKQVLFYHRWQLPDGGTVTRPFLMDVDGAGLRLLPAGRVTHSVWRSEDEILLWGALPGVATWMRQSRHLTGTMMRPALRLARKLFGRRMRHVTRDSYLLVGAGGGTPTPLGEGQLLVDGHPTFAPHDRQLVLTDTYEDSESHRHLLLFDMRNDRLHELGRLYSVRESNSTGWRCDLHPRWDRRGQRICIDSTHTGSRQIHVFDLLEMPEQ